MLLEKALAESVVWKRLGKSQALAGYVPHPAPCSDGSLQTCCRANAALAGLQSLRREAATRREAAAAPSPPSSAPEVTSALLLRCKDARAVPRRAFRARRLGYPQNQGFSAGVCSLRAPRAALWTPYLLGEGSVIAPTQKPRASWGEGCSFFLFPRLPALKVSPPPPPRCLLDSLCLEDHSRGRSL